MALSALITSFIRGWKVAMVLPSLSSMRLHEHRSRTDAMVGEGSIGAPHLAHASPHMDQTQAHERHGYQDC